MKKVLLINTAFNKGGAAAIANYLFSYLNSNDKYGIKIYFVYGRGDNDLELKHSLKFSYQIEVYLHAFITRMTGMQGYGSCLSTKRLERFILKEKFDLIHLHNIHGYYLNLSFIKFLKKNKISVIWTLHDGWPMTGRCAYWFNCEKWKTGCRNCPDLFLYPKTFIDSSAFMWRKKKNYFSSGWNPIIVCPSQWLADKVKKSFLRKFKIEVIPNAVDTAIFIPKDKIKMKKKLGIKPDKKIVLFIAATLKDERKGVKYFLKALHCIKSDKWSVITIGQKINVIDNNIDIRQLGYIKEKKEMAKIYNVADVFCISSIDDNFPTTVLESMSCGIPVVGFKTGGIPEQINKDCGILIEKKDSKSLGKAIEKLLNDEEIRKKYSEKCRERVLKNYSMKKFIDKYVNLYKKLIKEDKQ